MSEQTPADVLNGLVRDRVASRLWKREVALWEADPASPGGREVAKRLGWLDVAEHMRSQVADLEAFAESVSADGITDALVLGMGGSSLCPEVLARTFPATRLRVHVLDSTDPAAVHRYDQRSRSLDHDIQQPAETFLGLDPRTTLYLVSSKSGTTTEPLAFYTHFRKLADAALGDRAGSHFAAITDPGTPLAERARSEGFRRVFENPPDIGGRYSALSYFGLVPAALQGIDIGALLERAMAMAGRCREDGAGNPGLELGAALAAWAGTGRDKVTLVAPAAMESFGLWLEQLIAESTGKLGRGLVPVAGEPLGEPAVYGQDRLFIELRLGGEGHAGLAALREAGHPVVTLDLSDELDIGGEFFRWEFAVAVACHVIGVNAFDQPDVEAAKQATRELLAGRDADGRLPEPARLDLAGGISALLLSEGQPEKDAARNQSHGAYVGPPNDAVAQALAELLNQVKAGDYLAVMVFSKPDGATDGVLSDLRVILRHLTGCAVTIGYGPRFLHSTGQLHKGGPPSCVFLQLLSDDQLDLEIPGSDYNFSILKRAQALGDRAALLRADRRGLSLNLPPQEPQGLGGVAAAAAVLAGRQMSGMP